MTPDDIEKAVKLAQYLTGPNWKSKGTNDREHLFARAVLALSKELERFKDAFSSNEAEIVKQPESVSREELIDELDVDSYLGWVDATQERVADHLLRRYTITRKDGA